MRYPNVKLERAIKNLNIKTVKRFEMIYDASKIGNYTKGLDAGNELLPSLEYERRDEKNREIRHNKSIYNLAASNYVSKKPIADENSIFNSRRIESRYMCYGPIMYKGVIYSRDKRNRSTNNNAPISPFKWALRTSTILDMNVAEIDQGHDMFERKYGEEE